MAELSDERMLSELSLPGTHDTGALYEPIAGYSKNQELTIAEQLEAGVRYLDIRCGHLDDQFFIFHGVIYQMQTYAEVLATLYAFLDAHPDETLLVSIMEETRPNRVTRSFEATFSAYVAEAPERWVLAPEVPRLGDVRGKLVLLRRFSANAQLGIDATAWPDNSRAVFAIDNAASIRVQDAYIVTDNNEKWASITEMISETRKGDPATLYLNYTSGYQVIDGISNIPSVSDDINLRLDALLGEPANRRARLGVLVMDHVTPARVAAVIDSNEL